MKVLTPIQTQVGTSLGTEPIIVVGIKWTRSGGIVYYGDKDKLLKVSDLDIAMSAKTGQSQSISITLDDTDGTIKKILNKHDIHKVNCTIYQGFNDTTSKVALFTGQISSPFTWSEGEQTVTFTVLTIIESKEIGISPEEGQFPFLSPESYGKMWPLCFGHVLHVPVTRVHQTLRGELDTRLGLVDPKLYAQLTQINKSLNYYNSLVGYYIGIYNQCTNMRPKLADLKAILQALIVRERELLKQVRAILVKIEKIKRDFAKIKDPTAEEIKTKDAAIAKLKVDLKKIIGEKPKKKDKIPDDGQVQDPRDENADEGDQKRLEILQDGVDESLADLQWLEEFTPDDINAINAEKRKLTELQRSLEQLRREIALKARPKDPERTGLLAIVEWNKMVCFRWIQIAQYLYKRKKEAAKKCIEAKNEADNLLHKKLQIENEICYQLQDVKSEVRILNGHEFAQNTNIDIVIKGLRWKGSFSGDVFTFTSPGIPLPLYSNLKCDSWISGPDNCGRAFDEINLDKFWISDQAKSLRGMFCLVETTGKYHMVKVIEQEDKECTFELIPLGDARDSGGRTSEGKAISFPPLGTNSITPGVFQAALIGQEGVFQPVKEEEKIDMLQWQLNEEELVAFLVLNQLLAKDNELPLLVGQMQPRDCFTVIGQDITKVIEVASTPLAHWQNYGIPIEELLKADRWVAEQKTIVTLPNDLTEIYVCNSLPSTIKAVMAYSTIDGIRELRPLPTSYYVKDEDLDLGHDIHITALYVTPPLQYETHGKWEDTLYVSLNSSVGPNVVDVLKHLILTYTDATCDSTTFTAVKAKLTKYPVNFALFDRQDVLTLINEIAWQARCALILENDVYKIIYLAEEPTSVKTITESDIELATLTLTTTETESLVTCLVASWRKNYLPLETYEDACKVILRHNVVKYGLHKMEKDFFIYNNKSLVVKAATFWIIRLANTWKYINFTTFIKNLKLELYDAITLDFLETYFASIDVKAVIESCKYSPDNLSITISAWVPVRLGEMTKYLYAWPSALPTMTQFPSIADIENEFAGGNGIGIHIEGIP